MVNKGALIDRCDLFTEKNCYTCFVKSITDTVIGFIKKEDLLHWIKKHPSIAKNIIASLADELTFQYGRLCCDAWEDSRERVVRLLLILAEKADAGTSIDPYQLSLKDLANELGIARETLSRHLHRLKEKEAIKLEHGRVRVIKKGLLRQILEGI